MSNKTGKVVVVASGYFDVLHQGHCEYLYRAKALGDVLIVIINSDEQARLKKEFVLMPIEQRIAIIRALSCVDAVMISIDKDGSVCESIRALRPHIFAKGGDRFASEIPEKKVCDELGIKIVDGLGDKVFSSRTVIKELIKNINGIPESYLNGK